MLSATVIGLLSASTLLGASVKLGDISTEIRSNSGTQVRIVVPGDFQYRISPIAGTAAEKIVVVLQGVSSGSDSTRKLNVNKGSIQQIRIANHSHDEVWVVLDLDGPVAFTASRPLTGGLTVDIRRIASAHGKIPSPQARNRGANLKLLSSARRPSLPPASPVNPSSPPTPKPPASNPVNESIVQISPQFELSILEDKNQDLPFLVQLKNGFLGFGEANSSQLQYLFQAAGSTWSPVPLPNGKASIADYFALQFTDNGSIKVEEIRQMNQIPAAATAYALFPASYRDVIYAQIRRVAAMQGRTGPLTAATIQFSLLDASGIEVKNVK